MFHLRKSIPISSNKNFSQVLKRLKGTLVVAEHDNTKLSSITLNAVTAASKFGGDITCLIAGSNCGKAVEQLSKVKGVSKNLVADNGAFEGFLPERLTPLILASQKQFSFTHIIAGASAFGKSLLPRIVTAKLDVSQENFSKGPSGTELSTFVKQELSKSDRPELSSAKKVMSGGRPLLSSVKKNMNGVISSTLFSPYQSMSNLILSNMKTPSIIPIRTIMRDHWPRPSESKRIRRHGWKKRMSTPQGRKIIMRRILKGRIYLTH